MSWMRALKVIALGLGLAYAVPLACGSGGVVGGKCRSGFVNCDGKCVRLSDDVDNCGTCGNICAADEGCGLGVCDPDVPRPQGGSSSGGAANQGGAGTAGNEQGMGGELPDGGFFDSPVDGEGDAGPVECLPPHDEPSHCGDCDTVCREPTPLCAPTSDGESFECVPVCDPPLVECRGQCLDPDSFLSDPDNCGKCRRECASDICQAGECVEARFGHAALLCMDLNSTMTDSAQTDVLGNAVFLPAVNPVKVLAYTRGANPTAVSKVNALINAEGATRGRSANITTATTDDMVASRLNITDFHVLLVHDLDRAESGEPRSTAEAWESSSVITSFWRAGGTVIVLNGSDGTGEMHEFITAANLMTISGQTEIPPGPPTMPNQVKNNAPADALGAGVLNEFAATSHTCTFTTAVAPDSETIFVVTDSAGDPVVIHRVIAP